MKDRYLSSLAAVGFAALLYGPSPAQAQGYLGSNLRSFAVLGYSTVTNTGLSVVTGDLGVSPGTAVTGFPPGIVTGTIHAADATAAAAQVDLTTAFTTLTGQPCGLDLTGTDLGGLTLTPGVYCFSTSAQLTGTLTLNALGDPNAVWVFRIGSTLTTASGSSVVFINGSNANACGAQWGVGSSATLGTTTSFAGNILAQASITLNNNANVIGRALARAGAVTLDDNDVSFAACGAGGGADGAPPPFPPPPSPALDFFTVTPCRIIDTRDVGGPVVAGSDRTFTIAGLTCNIPLTARAVSLNIAVTQPTAAGNVRLFPAGAPAPTTSTINYVAGQTRTNNAVVGLSVSGELTARCQPVGSTHLILDVNGYFE